MTLNHSIKKKIIFIIIPMLIIMTVFFLIIKPTINSINDTRDRINAQKQELEQKIKQVTRLKQNQQKLKEVENKLSILDDFFIIPNQEINFVTKLENIATKNNVTQKINLADTNPSQPNSQPQNKKFLAINIEVNGNTENVFNYLTEIEQASFYFNITDLDIEAKEQSGSMPNIDGRLSNTNSSLYLKIKGKVYILQI